MIPLAMAGECLRSVVDTYRVAVRTTEVVSVTMCVTCGVVASSRPPW